MLLASLGIGALLPAPSGPTPVALGLAPYARAVVPTATRPAVRPMAASRPVSISIPALGVESAVIDLGLRRDGTMEVPPGAYPAGWYDRSPTPGERGPAVLAGHVDWAGQRGVFAGLRNLTKGNDVVIRRRDGSTATFRVDSVSSYPKEAFPAQTVYGDLDHAGLRLITCGGAFDTAQQSYVDNIVVFATLEKTTAGRARAGGSKTTPVSATSAIRLDR